MRSTVPHPRPALPRTRWPPRSRTSRQGQGGDPSLHGRAPSQFELFDYKPELAKIEGKPLPPSVIGGQRYAFIRPDAAVLGPRFKFARHGQCGAELSEMLPHLAKVVDDICLVKSGPYRPVQSCPAQIFFNSGFSQPGRPCMGSWVLYGLGAETKDLPAFIVMSTGAGISGGAANWSSGFMPTIYAGVRLRNSGSPILDVASPAGCDAEVQRETLELVSDLDRQRLDAVGDPEIATPDQLLRNGPAAANLGPRTDGSSTARARPRSISTDAIRTSRPSRGRASWRGGWSSAACAS